MQGFNLEAKQRWHDCSLIPFATSGGSSIKKACEDLKATYPDVKWKEGKLLNRASKKDLEDWVKK